MSRIIVKNLPKKTTAEKLKSMFSVKGDITDVSLKYSKTGVFRNFAFIGFKNEEQANSAKDYFHETFVDSSKIKVEICQNLGSTEVKAWSKHTKNKQINNNNNTTAKEPLPQKTIGSKSKKVAELEADPQFAEFLEIHKNRQVKSLWSNDGILPNQQNTQEDSETGDSSSEDENTKSPQIEAKTEVKTEIINKKTQKIEYLVKIRGIPKKTNRKDIKAFFGQLKYTSLRTPANARDVAYVQFKNEKDLKQALIKHRGFLNGSRVFITDFTRKPEDNSIDEKKAYEDKSKASETLIETGRIFVRNLVYSCTEADLEAVFKPFGPLTEVTLTVDKLTQKIKGFGFVTFMLPEHAVKAFEALDGTIFQGRLFHLLPADPPRSDRLDEDASFKEKKDHKLKEQSKNSHTWNSLFLGANAVADVMASKYNTTKSKLLDSNKGESIAVRMALGETQIVSETKDFLTENGVDLKAFETQNTERSKNVILVKNLPAKTSPGELMAVFEKFGQVNQILLPPSGITAIVEFQNQHEAKTAFTNTAYKRFGSSPLYLEWAPSNVFTPVNEEKVKKNIEKETSKQEKDEIETEEKQLDEDEDEDEIESGATLYIKNLNFDTNEENIKTHFRSCGKIRTVTVATKKDPKNPGSLLSMGYGFIEFKKKKSAQKAMKEMQHSKLEGHALELKVSNRTTSADQGKARKTVSKKEQKTSKILVRNIPFEANVKEIRELFRVFGELKSLRVPQKAMGSHRGFGFVDFITRQDAKRAMESLSQSTHLYGRRLVLEWADTDDTDVDTLRRKTADNFQPGLSKSKKLKQAIQEDL